METTPEAEATEVFEPAAEAAELDDVATYLDPDTHSWTPEQVEHAYLAEKSAQAAVCTVPEVLRDNPALFEALCRRVAHNLALRALPLGVQATMSEAAVAQTRVGGTDAEVRRLEAPYRKRRVG